MVGEGLKTLQYYGEKGATDKSDTLSVVIGPQVFMYAVHDGQAISEIGHVKYEHATRGDDAASVIRSLVGNFRLRDRQFSKVCAALQSPRFVLLPQAYAAEGSERSYLSFSSGETAVRTALTHRVAGTHLSFEPDPDVIDEISRAFPGALVRHSGAVNISLLMQHPSLSACDVLLVVADGYIELCTKRNGDLLFYNTFISNASEDTLYYLLFMMEQFALDPASVRVALAGEIGLDEPLAKDLKKYLPHLVPVVAHGMKRTGQVAQLPEHFYFTLLNQHLCEL